ncbi:tetratricopeptide repeat protein [Chitinophaga oryzae]|uniref:Tetratricopeptide repeat protein n=1 Tax=Chitinophaga oryzae TaxID=2725414 RepID=A0AAE6ZE56_9BACT|nr:tetratricopeptide repeat protein [Chitinophaga oryzae]QJB31009.1 tetratricopeptide repeat protein [Chitinophaga oryzae]QJB37493.1 tetratricopeptide repeat protein [Chitinophaga oryzae]
MNTISLPIRSAGIRGTLCLLACILLWSCRSGEKLYNKGKYDNAVTAFVKKLQRKPQDATALQLLPEAYRQAQKMHEDRVNNLLRSNNQLKWEPIRNEYRTMQRLYEAIHSSPAALKIVTPKDYSDAITGALENAAETRYDRGIALMQRGDKASARKAYDEFGAALKLIPNYRDAQERKDDAFQAGVVYVVVSEVDVRSPYFQFSADQFRDYLVRSLQQRNVNRFVVFYDERTARNENLRPDQYIALRFLDFMVGQTYVDRARREVSKEIVTGTTRDTTGKTINTYTTVRATIVTTKTTVESRGLLDYQIADIHNGRILRSDRIPGSYTWFNQFATYTGDSRALSEADLAIIGGRDLPPPPPQDLFMEFTRPIYNQLEKDLRDYYAYID